jgi:hypothetical protein
MELPTERELIARLSKDLSFPPLVTVRIKQEPVTREGAGSPPGRSDLVIDFAWRGTEREFLAEVKSRSTPRVIDEAVHRAQRLVNLSRVPGCYPLVVVPYLSTDALSSLADANVSGIDLSGNGVVIVPGEWFIYRTGAPNRYPSSAPIKNVFRGTSSLVARVFLMRREYGSVNEIYEEIKRRGGEITLPTVSKALKALQEELVVGRDTRPLMEQAARRQMIIGNSTVGSVGENLGPLAFDELRSTQSKIRLLDPGRLLELIERSYRRPVGQRRMQGKFAGGRSVGLAAMSANADEASIRVVGDDPTRYAIIPGGAQALAVYTPSIETLLRGVAFTEDSRFPEVELIETDDQTIYFDRRRTADFYWISPLETYLILRGAGKREREGAEQMREAIKEFRYYM